MFSHTVVLCARQFMLSPNWKHQKTSSAAFQHSLVGRRWSVCSAGVLHLLCCIHYFSPIETYILWTSNGVTDENVAISFIFISNLYDLSLESFHCFYHIISSFPAFPSVSSQIKCEASQTLSPCIAAESSLWHWHAGLQNTVWYSVRVKPVLHQTQSVRGRPGDSGLGTCLHTAPHLYTQEVEVELWKCIGVCSFSNV